MKRISKNPVNEIRTVLDKYKGVIDGLLEAYNTKWAEDYAEIKSHEGDYTENFMDKLLSEKRAENLAGLQPEYDRAHKWASESVDFYLSALKRGFDAYFMSGCRPEFIARLQGIKDFGVDSGLYPSYKELELLCQNASNYAERQAVKGLLNQIDKAYMEDKKSKREKDASSSPYNPINFDKFIGSVGAEIDEAYEDLQNYADTCRRVVNHYCAGDKSIYILTGNFGYTYNPSVEEYNYYNQDKDHPIIPVKVENRKFETYGVGADAYWTSSNVRELEATIDRLNQTAERKTRLSASESELLTSLFGEIPTYNLKRVVPEVAEKLPQVGALIEISDKYSEYLFND